MEANALLEGKSIPELEKLKTTAFKGNEGAIKVIDEYIADKVAVELAEAVRAEFIAKVEALAVDLPKPLDVNSIHFIWHPDAMKEDKTQPPEVVRVCTKGAVVVDEVTIEEAVWEEKESYPLIPDPSWKIEVNKIYTPARGGSVQASTSSGKRAITVYKLNGIQAPTLVGNFSTGEAACKHLGIDSRKGSANLKLRTEGYILEDYTGSSFIS